MLILEQNFSIKSTLPKVKVFSLLQPWRHLIIVGDDDDVIYDSSDFAIGESFRPNRGFD